MSDKPYPYLTWPCPSKLEGVEYLHGAVFEGHQSLPIEQREGFSFNILESRFVCEDESEPKICKHLLTIMSPDGPLSFVLDVELPEWSQ